MRYANVLRAVIWLSGPKGDARDRSISGAGSAVLPRLLRPLFSLALPSSLAVRYGGLSDADSLTKDSYCDSRLFSMFRYSFLSLPAAFVV